jgi:hypothetical protein
MPHAVKSLHKEKAGDYVLLMANFCAQRCSRYTCLPCSRHRVDAPTVAKR